MELQVKENREAVFKGGELTDNFQLLSDAVELI